MKKGSKHTKEAIIKISENNWLKGKGYLREGELNPMWGKESWNKGLTFDNEYRKKISERTKEAMKRPEVREKIKNRRKAIGNDFWKGKTGKAHSKSERSVLVLRGKAIVKDSRKELGEYCEKVYGIPYSGINSKWISTNKIPDKWIDYGVEFVGNYKFYQDLIKKSIE